MALQQGAGAVAPATAPQSGSPGWGLFAGGVLLGGTVAAGAAYLAVRYANTSGAGEEGRRGGGSASRRRTAGRLSREAHACRLRSRTTRSKMGTQKPYIQMAMGCRGIASCGWCTK